MHANSALSTQNSSDETVHDSDVERAPDQNRASRQLSTTQLLELARKVAELLRYELRIERERQG